MPHDKPREGEKCPKCKGMPGRTQHNCKCECHKKTSILAEALRINGYPSLADLVNRVFKR